MGKGEFFGFLMQGASPLASPGLNPSGAGAGAAYHAPTGGLPRRCRITLPSLSPTGGRGVFGCRLNLPHHRFFVPIPRPPSPMGKGEFFGFLMQGASPLASPRLNPGGAGAEGAILRQVGGLPRRCRITLPSLSPTGGHGVFGRRIYQPYHKVFPPSPRPALAERSSPMGKGEFFGFLMQGASPLASPGLNPGGIGAGAAYHAPVGARAERGRFVTGRGANGGLHQQFIREKFLGVWGLLSRSPQRSSFLRFFVSSL